MALRPSLLLVAPLLVLLAACGDDSGSGSTGSSESTGSSTESTSGSGGGDSGSGSSTTGSGPGSSTTTGAGTTTSSGEGGSGAGGSGSGAGTGSGGDPSTTSSGTGGESGQLVINEISADGDDWIELFNAGVGPVDLSGMKVCDQEEPGVPKLEDAIIIPDDTVLEPGAYLFILADQDTPAEGFTDVCDPGPAPCLQAGFGLSQGDGDEVFVLDFEDVLVTSEPYPADAAVEPTTWGRLPNGTGDFTVTAATPGAENEAAPR
jgi:hypothetical protein